MVKGESSPLRKADVKKYVFLTILFLLVIASFFIIRPYLIPLISAFVLAYLCKPFYLYISKKIPKSISAIICIFLAIILIIIPFSLVIGGLFSQTQAFLQEESIDNLISTVSESQVIQFLEIDLENWRERVASTTIWLLKSSVAFLPALFLALIVTLFSMYYILIKWDILVLKLKNYIPLRNKDETVRDLLESTNGIVYGTVLIAILQFIIAVIGFYISGVKLFLLLPLLVFFLAFIPGVGSTFVWIPTSIYYLAVQNYPTAIGVLITGAILSVYIDTIFRNKYIGEKTKISPIIMLVGVLGGIPLFGIFGFIIGPLILVYTVKILEESLS